MKNSRIFKRVLAVALICLMVCSLAACATKLNGTYTSSEGLIKQSLTFEDDKVKGSILGMEIEGTYEIKDGKIIISYGVGPLHYDQEKTFEKKGSSIFIDGVEYVKEK